jgi:hypothetical protein
MNDKAQVITITEKKTDIVPLAPADRSKQIAACIRGLGLLDQGKTQQAFKLMKGCTYGDLQSAIRALNRRAEFGRKLVSIFDKDGGTDEDTSIGRMMDRAQYGNKEAAMLASCGFGNRRFD